MDNQALKNRFGIIGNAPGLNYALDIAAQVANTDLSVLIHGESGVGKEVFSHIIHALSPRKHNKFIAVNCGAIPEGTIDSELFGHEKGSFTGAVDSRKGYFETVNGGTIFLDEVAEMPLGTQARLLRVLETGEYIRVGSSKVQKTDVRVIAATNKDMLDLIQTGKFREDLYYRLNTVPIRVPSLRERKEDIPLLFRKFALDFSERYRSEPIRMSDDALQFIREYPWPGNVRQLKNMAEQISVLARGEEVTAEMIKKLLPEVNTNRLPVLAGTSSSGQEFANEREILYKMFFDVKRDVTELKKMFFEFLQNPALFNNAKAMEGIHDYIVSGTASPVIDTAPVVLHPVTNGEKVNSRVDEHQEVEESLNLTEVEKELIIKALRKHKGKRREAANDLGISERTLYRKLKEYDINE
ncbi:MAG: sigma-54-dependent Fis family transcriptional regulator [Chitinophagaceae bacterium]|nr:sigma-54-dependent Fis family transcriptional regulator [Chitinophagaceae bacterium]